MTGPCALCGQPIVRYGPKGRSVCVRCRRTGRKAVEPQSFEPQHDSP